MCSRVWAHRATCAARIGVCARTRPASTDHAECTARDGWATALAERCTADAEPFWVLGSAVRGRIAADAMLLNPLTAEGMHHINGNALYRLHDPLLATIAAEAESASSSDGYDIGLARVVMHRPIKLAWSAHVAHCFAYSNAIWNAYGDYSPAVARSSGALLVHQGTPTDV